MSDKKGKGPFGDLPKDFFKDFYIHFEGPRAGRVFDPEAVEAALRREPAYELPKFILPSPESEARDEAATDAAMEFFKRFKDVPDAGPVVTIVQGLLGRVANLLTHLANAAFVNSMLHGEGVNGREAQLALLRELKIPRETLQQLLKEAKS